jgi:hypothetical protein
LSEMITISDQVISETVPRTASGVGMLSPACCLSCLSQRVEGTCSNVAIDNAERAERRHCGEHLRGIACSGRSGNRSHGNPQQVRPPPILVVFSAKSDQQDRRKSGQWAHGVLQRARHVRRARLVHRKGLKIFATRRRRADYRLDQRGASGC